MKSTKAKNYVIAAIIYAAVFAIYNLFVFLIFNNFNNIFWIYCCKIFISIIFSSF